METHLRPMSLGEILDRTAQLYRENFLIFAGIFAFWSAVVLAVNLIILGLQHLIPSLVFTGKNFKMTLVLSGIQLIVSFLFVGAAIAAISRAVSWLHLGEPASIRAAYRSTLPRLGRYLGLMALAGFIVYAPILVLYAAMFGSMYHFGFFANPGQPPNLTPQDSIWLVGTLVTIFLLFIPATIYTILMTLRYSLAVPACVLEGLKPRDSIRRSIQLSKGSRGQIFVLFLLIGAIKIGLTLLTQFFVFIAAFKHPGAQLSPGILALSQTLAFFTNTFLGPITATGLTLFYYDQRIRKEGFDIEWMMQAAGMTAPLAPPAPASTEPSPATAPPESPVAAERAAESAPPEPASPAAPVEASEPAPAADPPPPESPHG